MDRFASRRLNIVGGQGSGKTTLADRILDTFTSCVIVDPQDEWEDKPGRTVYVPKHTDYGESMKAELDEVCRQLVRTDKRTRQTDALLVDDADQFFPNGRPLPSEIGFLHTSMRHLAPGPGCDREQEGLTLILVYRRPADISTKLVGMAHHTFWFQTFGSRDLTTAEHMMHGLSRELRALQSHEFIEVTNGGKVAAYHPLDIAS